jgi:hypothetical protein
VPVGDLPAIDGAYGGGFSRGLINQSGDGVATHALSMVRPATGR